MNEIKINNLRLSKRSCNALTKNNVCNLGDLLKLDVEVIDHFRNIGEKSKSEILSLLQLLNDKNRKNDIELNEFLNEKFIALLNAYNINNVNQLSKINIDEVIYSKLDKGQVETIEHCSLSNRSKNQLIKNGYVYVSELKGLTDNTLDEIKNLGLKSIQEIKEFRDNLSIDEESSFKLPNNMSIESLRYVDIDEIINDKYILKILKVNNIQVLGVLFDLSHEDIKKFRNTDDITVKKIQNICISLREQTNLINRNLYKLANKNSNKSIKELIYENIPKTESKLSIKFLFDNKYVSKINIEDYGFSNKEKKLINLFDLNEIECLLKYSYNSLLKSARISKNSLNIVLETLLNQIVVKNKSEFYIGELSRLYLKKSKFSYLLTMRENLLSDVLKQANNAISEMLSDECFSINHELDLMMGNSFLDSKISGCEYNNFVAQEIVYSFIKCNPSIYTKNEICNYLSEHFINLDIFGIFDEIMNLDLIALDKYEKIYFKRPSILTYVKENYNENIYLMMKLRLQGNTLEEIGEETNVTRERVRQVIKKVIENTNQVFKEDENAYWFKNYDLDSKIYCYLFDDSLYNYLSNRYEKGGLSWESILNDDKASIYLKTLVRNKLLKGKIEIDDKIISKNRISIINYVLEEYGQEILHLDELLEVIHLFLDDFGLEKNEFDINTRYLENRLSDTSNAVSRGKKYYRYYDYEAYNWDLFYEEINFDEWKDLEISTYILFISHPLLMEAFDIKHENELHNIIRRTSEERTDLLNIELTRMPNISIGNVNREQQVKDLMYKHAPLYVEEFVNKYFEVFGVKQQTVRANYLKYIDQYISDDYIKEGSDSINKKDVNNVRAIINNKEFMFIEDVKQELEYEIENLQIILKHLNYKTFTSYILKNKYDTIVKYFDEIFYKDKEIVDLTTIDKRVWNLSSFGSWLYDKYKTMELLEFSPKKYITKKKLNELGLSLEVLTSFRQEVLDKLSDKKVWSITTIIDVIDNEEIDVFGFDSIFYRSILRGLENIYSNKIGGNYLLKKDEHFTVSSLIEEEVTQIKMIDIFDLTEIINEKYEINLEYYKLIEVIKHTNMYYDEIMEKVYLDLNYYYEEFEV
ncbi:DNA-directed RNA polymerase subunit alpha C-terminal domain-containing protein [Staphylococcus caeli]|uniref:DNA-directed RNA polymerase subunit alpha C-terminal domain-containing protein n=1 Tax=Staphylococcus caeli TaxID=2201815 RepID=UPI003F5735F0